MQLGDCLFKSDRKWSEEYDIVAATAVVNDHSGCILVCLLSTGKVTKLYVPMKNVGACQQYRRLTKPETANQFDLTLSSLSRTEGRGYSVY